MVVQEDVNEPTLEERLESAAADSSIAEEVEGMSDEEVLEELDQLEADGELEVEGDPVAGGENRIPQHRFNEVNNALKEMRESEAETRDQLAESQDKLVKMAELLEAKDADIATLNEIKSFVNDPDMKDHVIAIDNKLKGIEVEMDKGNIEPEDAVRQAQDLLEQTREEMRDTQADMQTDQLVNTADNIAERLLNALPEEYNDEDLGVISDLFKEKIDWDACVAQPDYISEILTEDFQETIDRYGMPRGALFDTEEVDLLTEDNVVDEQTPEEELVELMDLPWGETKQVEVGNKTVTKPEMSDDDFNKVLAQAMKLANANKDR
jgi:hypothetical protein